MSEPWWKSYFGDDFFDLHIDLFPEEDSRREVASMVEMLGLPADARVLDVPCGWGRHTQLLARGGFQAVGADLSPALLARAERGKRAPAYTAADIRFLPFRDASFDCPAARRPL